MRYTTGRQPSANLQDLMATMARFERLTDVDGIQGKFDAAEARVRNESAQTAAAPRDVEHYPRLPIVSTDMSVTQRNAYYDETGFYLHTFQVTRERLFSPLLHLTPGQHTRLMDAIATRTHWIKLA